MIASKIAASSSPKRRFCFLQGPHGPFFPELSDALRHLGHETFRIGFNVGDAHEWGKREGYLPYREPIEAWRGGAADLLQREGADDLVIYGDARPYHAIAVEAAEKLGLRVHFFEEGYLRPFWITYERDGVNGRSPLMRIALEDIEEHGLEDVAADDIPPARWGELNAHIAHSLRYHIRNHFLNGSYPNFYRHLPDRPVDDWRNVAGRVFYQPVLRLRRRARERQVTTDSRPYHLVLLQLGWDASMRRYSAFSSVSEVIDTCMEAFSAGAPPGETIVFKTHPLEDGREGLERSATEAASRHGVAADRMAFIEGGKLAALISGAKSVVTVNSTAAQQALWRDKPVIALGQAIFAKPGLVSQQSLTDFFSAPETPDPALYRLFRRFLLATSQISGGFYTPHGRSSAMTPAVRAMLSDEDPYAQFVRRDRPRIRALP